MAALTKEIADILNEQGDEACGLSVSGRTVTITLPRTFPAEILIEELGYLAGLSQVRDFADTYSIPAAELEPILTRFRKEIEGRK